ncbi:Ryanodine receptor isoform 2 [Schistosoma japonicum]|uniref:Ryanodine receptor isoform 2 n=1 Tax=Schistosoma japonicum TaxID=6182 RepID=A0A4Z2DMG0_SCHJA|nr:Ryanodine receptor isoform 2 [Schistosoma japonicum]
MSSLPAEEETSFLRTEDFICLSCFSHGSSERLCLAAEGFGNRMCSLEIISRESPPPNMPPCVFVLDQALSVRALQEMLSIQHQSSDGGGQSGHRTLLYGHAIRLKHRESNMYLSCLSTSTSQDKLAFDVGLQQNAESEACWWTIHPASKQRSVGEKVRIGDDLILVSVSSERYLHVYGEVNSSHGVIASFQQTLWTVLPVSSGAIRQKSMHMVLGGDVVRLFHGDESLTAACATESEEFSPSITMAVNGTAPGSPPNKMPRPSIMNCDPLSSSRYAVMYEIGAVSTSACSLWRIEHKKTKWSAGFFSWGCEIRLRHVTTGRYLGVLPSEANGSGHCDVVTLSAHEATNAASIFLIRPSKDDKKRMEEHEAEGMGEPDVRLGETLTYLQHAASGRWLSYEAYETRKRGVGRVEEKKAVLLVEGHMDDLFSLVRAQDEEIRSASAIRRCTSVFNNFIHTLNYISSPQNISLPIQQCQYNLSSGHLLGEVTQCLEDLIEFFAQPSPHEDHEIQQSKLAALRNRQNLFQNEGMIGHVLSTIEKFTGTFQTRREFSQALGEDKADQFDELGNYLYLLLAALIRGNRENCAQFATPTRLDWLFNRLELQQGFAEGVLDALHCVLTDSDEALYLITERHIRTLIGLLDKQGRDPRVLQALCSLCYGRQGGAVRLNQELIYETLLPQKDLLLQTKLVDQCGSVRPNIFVGYKDGGAMYPKWYFEVIIDLLETVTHQPAKIRVGWANTEGYNAHPCGGPGWGAASLGDDLFSYAFDGSCLWAGGKPKQATIGTDETTNEETASNVPLKRGDIIGCLLDLTGPVIQFNVNGRLVKGYFQDFNITGLFYPCISMNAKASARFLLGSNQGRLHHGPPPGYSPICYARQPGQKLRLEPVFTFGQLDKYVFTGPLNSPTPQQYVFVPRTVRTSHIQLPNYVEIVRDRLAENLHEMWSMRKIDQGWKYGERRDDENGLHPCLTTFDKLPPSDRQYNVTLAYETLRTIIGLGYNITYEPLPEGTRLRTMKLPNSFTQVNGYKPQPLDLTQVRLSVRLEVLVDQLAENTHNMWARDRIALGWTYGFVEDHSQKRSPHLVPFSEVDPIIQQSNKDTAIETVKTLLVYGYTLEPISSESSDAGRSNSTMDYSGPTRTYRGQITRAVTRGKWYYEAEILTSGFIRIGWAKKSAPPDLIIGSNNSSYGFAAHQARKWHRNGSAYGTVCQPGDVIGCMMDLIDKTISFSLNGELMMDPLGLEIAFKHIKVDEGYVPAFSLGSGQHVKINFGNDVQSLKFFTYCGLQEGYKPLGVNMCRPLPMWYSREDPSLFVDIGRQHPSLKVNVSSGTTPTFKVTVKQADYMSSEETQFLRLSLGTRCKDHFTSKSLNERHAHLDALRRQLEPEPAYTQGVSAGTTSNLVIMGQDMTASTLEVRDRRGKKIRLGNMFKKARSRDPSPEVTSTLGGGGGSLLSGGGSSLTGGKRGGAQATTSSLGPSGGGGQGSAGSGSLLSATAGGFSSGISGQQFAPTQTPQIDHNYPGVTGGQVQMQYTGISTSGGAPNGMKNTRAGAINLDEMDLFLPAPGGHTSPLANLVDEFSFTVLVLPGQDPGLVHIGWVTSYFKLAKTSKQDHISGFLHNVSSQLQFDTTHGQLHGQSNQQTMLGDTGGSIQPYAADLFTVRQAAVCLLESDLTLKSAVAERASFMVNLGQLLNQMATPEDLGKRMSQGLSLTCWVDIATGTLGFDLNGRDSGIRFQVEPSTRLFAAVFYRPTVKEAIHFEFGRRNRYTLPITASMLRPPRCTSTVLPHRLRVQALERVHWARVPPKSMKMHSMKISKLRGWSTIIECPVSEIAVRLPESDRCFTALELDEMQELLKFHSHTLELYRALCCHDNHNVAQYLTNHVDEHQLLYVMTASDMPGPLRSGFIDLMLVMHISSHVKLKQVTGKEFIVPMFKNEPKTKKNLFNFDEQIGEVDGKELSDEGYKVGDEEEKEEDEYDLDRIPAVGEHVSIRPELRTDSHLLIVQGQECPGADGTGNLPAPVTEKSKEENPIPAALNVTGSNGLLKLADCPSFPLVKLKLLCLNCLVDSVFKGGSIRDPAGGSYEHLLLPLIKTINCLLVMGTLDQNDIHTLLAILDPESFKTSLSLRGDSTYESLLQFHLPESVKLEICRLLHNLCDLQLRNRVEQVVKFASKFVQALQEDQNSRYMAIKKSNLPSSVAARRTREFRCPASIQMKSLLQMPGSGGPTGRLQEAPTIPPSNEPGSGEEDDEDELEGVETNRCAEEVKEMLRHFHKLLCDKLGVMLPENGENNLENKSDSNSSTDSRFDELRLHAPTLTHPSDTLSLASFGASYPSDELQAALAHLPLVPPDMGHPEEGSGTPPWILKFLWNMIIRKPSGNDSTVEVNEKNEHTSVTQFYRSGKRSLDGLIVYTIVKWANEGFIESLELIREMFSALHRQYNAIEELRNALEKTYVISVSSQDEVSRLLRSLGRVRSLLGVQLGSNEEILLKNCLWDLMNNKVFFQHPDLTRCLAVHETVMQLMVQTLTKATFEQPSGSATVKDALHSSNQAATDITVTGVTGSSLPVLHEEGLGSNSGHSIHYHQQQQQQSHQQRGSAGPTEMVVQCCRFLCYFCRTSRDNQKAMFEHLSYMLENSSMLLARPSLRGTCPLDVAYSSLMDNNELALALREKQLEKVAIYLSRCGVQSNAELLAKGYPDIGWDPVEGERFLDFLRFTVWVNGETVEENANLVVRLLIRRPECLGPALRGGSKVMKHSTGNTGTDGLEVPPGGPDGLNAVRESNGQVFNESDCQLNLAGGGLLKAMKEGLVMSAQIKLVKMAQEAEAAGLNPEEEDLGWRTVLMDYEDANLFTPLPYNFESLPPEDDPDYIDLGAAILTFHSILVNLLGYCAPDMETVKSESLRARSILQSLVSMADLEGVLSLRFILPPPKLEVQTNEDGEDEWVDKAGMPPGLLPEHKASVVLFLERVYGISDAATFLRLLENGFLPDLRAATLLDSAVVPDSDMALALNRYLCNSVLPLLTRHTQYLGEEGTAGGLFEATLQTVYRLSKCRSITNHQREVVCDFLVALMQQIRPPMMFALLKKMVSDLRTLSKESVVSLRVLTEFYQRCGTYYSSDGWTGSTQGATGNSAASADDDSGNIISGGSIGTGSSNGSAGYDNAGGRSGGDGESSASEEERSITAHLFILIFEKLSRQPYEPELFSYALPCLCSIACALPPDYSISQLNAMDQQNDSLGQSTGQSVFTSQMNTLLVPGAPRQETNDSPEELIHHDVFRPQPIDTSQIRLPVALNSLIERFAEHCHDSWALDLIEQGYSFGAHVDEVRRTHPNLRAFSQLPPQEQMRYIHPVTDTLKAMLACGWSVDGDENRYRGTSGETKHLRRQTITSDNLLNYNPSPKDLRGVNVTKEMLNMAERLADNAHNIWARQKMSDLEAIGGGVHQLLVPYDILTDNERKRYRRLTHELIKYLQYNGYRLTVRTGSNSTNTNTMHNGTGGTGGVRLHDNRNLTPTSRFAYGLLSKLLDYVDSAMSSVREPMPSSRYSTSRSWLSSSQDMKFFVKVVLPLVERYFETQHAYFLDPTAGASIDEKKMAATLFCKLFSLLRIKLNAFGHDVKIAVSCLQGLVQTIDVKAILKMGTAEDFVRGRILPFFVNAADDLCVVVRNLDVGRYSHVKGTIKRGACSVDYVHMVLLPVLKSMFEHLGKNECGEYLLVGNVQVTCYRILNALYKLGTTSAKHANRQSFVDELNRHRALIGECLAALASAFPVAFLEANLNSNNPLSITFNNRGGDYSLEARDVLEELSKTTGDLQSIIKQVELLAEAGATGAAEAPYLIEVTLPMLCSYLPHWWRKGPECMNVTSCSGGSNEGGVGQDNATGNLLPKTKENNFLTGATGPLTTVTADLMNRVLGSVLQLIQTNIDSQHAPWMTRIATRTQPIVAHSTADMLGQYFLPVSERLLEHALIVERVEEAYRAEKRSGSENVGEREEELSRLVEILVRNLFAFYPLLIKFVDRHRSSWLKKPTYETQRLFSAVARMFLVWARATKFKREEENFVSAHEIDRLSLIVPSGGNLTPGMNRNRTQTNGRNESSNLKNVKKAKTGPHTSLTVACIKRLLPVGLSQLGGREQELVLCAKRKLIKRESDSIIEAYLNNALDQEGDLDHRTQKWQKLLYKKIDQTIALTGRHAELVISTRKEVVDKILILSKVMHGLYMVDHPQTISKGAWKKLVSSQRKRAVMACFRMVPLYAMPTHRVMNLFLKGYITEWLDYEESLGVKLIEDVTSGALLKDLLKSNELLSAGGGNDNAPSTAHAIEGVQKSAESETGANQDLDMMDSTLDLDLSSVTIDPGSPVSTDPSKSASLQQTSSSQTSDNSSGQFAYRQDSSTSKPDPLTQLLVALCRSASDQAPDDPLYLAYAKIMSKSCSGEDEEEEEENSNEEGPSFQEQEEQKQQLLSEQNRLAERGAAEMVLLQLAASKGESTPVAQASIELGIALLLGGNIDVQGRMLDYLMRKKLSGFFTSLAGLTQKCSVLDLDTFERCNKAEGLAVGLSDMEGITNLYDADFTCKIFRFLQLLCEGHNLSFQDYLRTQAGNTVSVNLIISTVDYLLRLQESIMDFYWHYSNKDTIDESGKSSFIRAIKIGKQVFRSLTEYIQGPCIGNQLALAHSRLWDAVAGFIYVSAQMQDKLSRDPDQLDLLREFLNLQKELMIMLLSMLEGNVVNGPIAKQMVDTLTESSANVEMILRFFDIFLRMKVITTSEAFLAFDVNGDGWISNKEFRLALEQQKTYSTEEINYIIACVDNNADGRVDFKEFTERFYNPAEDIGFNLALLLTNLSEHVPSDPRLERLIGKARGVLDVFEPHLGRIEITGSNGRIERVYFEIRQQHIDQWEAPQIKESKRSFLHSVVGESGDKEKLECFVNFCEDTIFEMQHAQSINGDEADMALNRVAAFNRFLEITHLDFIGHVLSVIFHSIRPSQICATWQALRQMTIPDILLTLLGVIIGLIICVGRMGSHTLHLLWYIIVALASDFGQKRSLTHHHLAVRASMPWSVDRSSYLKVATTPSVIPHINEMDREQPWWLLSEDQQLLIERADPVHLATIEEEYAMMNSATSSNISHETTKVGNDISPKLSTTLKSINNNVASLNFPSSPYLKKTSSPIVSPITRSPTSVVNTPSSSPPSPISNQKQPEGCEESKANFNTRNYVISLFASNFYRFKISALILAFVINFLLLFSKVNQISQNGLGDADNDIGNELNGDVNIDGDSDNNDKELVEWITSGDTSSYVGPLIATLAFVHSILSFSTLVAYYYLKVPLVIFKREKEICRMLEFEGMWISSQPAEDNLRAHWDKLVLSTPSFPQMYWDKFVKKKVRNKYSIQYDHGEITTLLGMDKINPDTETGRFGLSKFFGGIDIQYLIWKWGVVFTDISFLYLAVYFAASAFGNLNYFLYACHLLDVAVSFKTLRTIIQSVTHNGKQLVLTVMLTSIVIYLYTVVAFNFFRKFYVKDNDGVPDPKCNDMKTCFIFHLHTGLRAGGGIGDEIEAPDGDESESYRILFDLTFFFFVIIILLAIIQGLIIDAFGDLRDQLEQVKEDLESKCFICGIGKEYFDKIPHGFEQHVEKEHNFANYMYFLMHIINKPDTEYTGQETYVWELYQQRCWDFFPIGDCFRKQYEEELQPK